MTVSLRFIKWVSISALAITLSLVSIATTQTTFQGPTAEPPEGNVDLSCPDNHALRQIGGEARLDCIPNTSIECKGGVVTWTAEPASATGYAGECTIGDKVYTTIVENADLPTTCADGQVIKYDETAVEGVGAWICGDNLLPQDCRGTNKALRWNANTGSWICGTTPTFPTPQDCRGTNKVLRWNATTSSWICGNVVTSTLATPPLCNSNNRVLRWNGSNWVCGNVATPPLCNEANKVLRWNGSNWVCGNIVTSTLATSPITNNMEVSLYSRTSTSSQRVQRVKFSYGGRSKCMESVNRVSPNISTYEYALQELLRRPLGGFSTADGSWPWDPDEGTLRKLVACSPNNAPAISGVPQTKEQMEKEVRELVGCSAPYSKGCVKFLSISRTNRYDTNNNFVKRVEFTLN